jgi:hypothetical protein
LARSEIGNAKMLGVKIGKTLRRNNASVWPDGYERLDMLLRPVADRLRPLWWATEHARYAFPTEWILERSDHGVDDWQPLSGPSHQRFEGAFVPGTERAVAPPGFLPEFAGVVSGDWTMLYGLPNDPASDPPLLAALGRLGWFHPPNSFPPAVDVVVRGIDWAYWEVFARDERLITEVHDHLREVPGLSVQLLAAVGS